MLWLVVLAVMGSYAGKISNVEKNDAIDYLPPSAQSTKVNTDLLHFPGGQSVPGVAVYLASGTVTPADRTVVSDQRSRAASRVHDLRPGGITESADHHALAFTFRRRPAGLQEADDGPEGHPAGPGEHPRPAGLDERRRRPHRRLGRRLQRRRRVLLLVTGLVVVTLLLLIYRSPLLWIVPILSVAGAVSLADFAVYELASHAGLTVSRESGGILTVLVFGAGTDYALLLTARYREELRRHEDKHEAMAYALRQAGPAILASASTVILGLLCLLAATLNSDSGLGPVGAIGIASASQRQLPRPSECPDWQISRCGSPGAVSTGLGRLMVSGGPVVGT